jgi:hypothetical protein
MRFRRHRYLALILLTAGASAAGCHESEGPCIACLGPIVTPAPAQARIVVGDTGSVILMVPADEARIAWQSSRPEIARLDTLLRGGRQAVLRGVATGEAALLYTVTSANQVVTGSVPVQVTARP